MSIVTFIIPTIGRSSLNDALNSLYKQTIQDWKAIVIFDGLSPNITINDERVSILTCEKLGTKEMINGIEKANGAGRVRNFGIQHCNTEWVAFLDDDDTLAHTYLETLYNEIHLCFNVDAVIFRMYHPDYGVLPKVESTHFQKYEVGISFAIKKKVFDQGICFVSGHDEDYVFLCNVYDNKYKICMSPYVKYFVNNANHTEIFPKKGRRMILNSNKQ
tara:strand:+ start:207 stop:857 length:651 start_codon:yes stop_codon:yes gene_type:complete